MRAQVSGKFLATVAASAASVTSIGVVDAKAADAQATDPSVIDSRINIAFEGAVYMSDVHNGDDKLGDSNGDLYGSIALTRQISPDIDWRLAGAYHAGNDRNWDVNVTQPEGTFNLSVGDSFNFQTLDFDVGKHVKVQAADIRFFGGLRLLHVKEKFGVSEGIFPTDPTDKSGTVDKVGTSEFYGIGPRIGAEAYYPLGETWGLTGAVSGSAMWGRQTTKLALDALTNDPSSPDPQPEANHFGISQHSNEVVTNVDLAAGVTWAPWTNTSFTAGYKVEQWHNLLQNADKNTQTFHGPFLRLDVKM
ncbi:MAG: Lpg1974 family pore-forming outer membrane protein [Mesorhizobium sp.]